MSKLEESTWPVGKCLCGTPSIIRHSYSMDHGYGGGSFHDCLECHTCSQEWDLQGSFLVHLESRRAATARIETARRRQSSLRQELASIVNGVATRVYAGRSFQNQTREWEEATRAGLFRGTLIQFRKARRGKRFLDAIIPSPSSTCFRDHATSSERGRGTQLQTEIAALDAEITAAEASVRRVAYEKA